ncbi:MAG TPA: hypothetical protein VIK39_15740 [Candidatus Angelobacter sp.]
MRPLDDKKEFQAGGSEDEFRTGSFTQESPDQEMETELSEEELAAEMEPFTPADWKQEIPGYTDQEYEEKLPDHTRASWMSPVVSCLFGTLLGAAIAGGLVGDLPQVRQVRMFFVFLLVLAPLLSCVGYWFFVLRLEIVAKKMQDEQENLVDSEPIHPK